MDHERLMAATARGNAQAFSGLVDRHADRLMALAFNVLGSRSKVALHEALGKLRRQTDTAQGLIHAAMVDTAGALTAEQRRAWAERQWRRRRLPGEDRVEPGGADSDAAEEAPSAPGEKPGQLGG